MTPSDLIDLGFWLFPIRPDDKKPAVTGWQRKATRDKEQAQRWLDGGFNLGIFTGKYGDGQGALLVVDVDCRDGKPGRKSLFALEMAIGELPDTFTVETPSGGQHLYFRVEDALRSGANTLGKGVDTRSGGGYVVAPGSVIGGKRYVAGSGPVAPAPVGLTARLSAARAGRDRGTATSAVQIDQDAARLRGAKYLRDGAPLAIEGGGGDATTFKVAARLKDFGLDKAIAFDLMLEHWNGRCQPPWDSDELATKVENAYEYGENTVGSSSPEADFKPILRVPDVQSDEGGEAEQPGSVHPLRSINESYAYVVAGGGDHILFETTDINDKEVIEHLSVGTFKNKLAADKFAPDGGRLMKIADAWMEWTGRRSYEGLVFRPGLEVPDRFYNLWRGFACDPLADDEQPTTEGKDAVDAWLQHLRDNVCRGEGSLSRWLTGYFAHLVQRPFEKPLVALVFRGSKGVGKNALVERVGDLLGAHFLLTSNRRYLVGNFNGHLENCLLFALDEAFWSGDKQAEGTLKDLITGKHHVIEHKGKEPYTVDNRTRIAIIGNEDWVVPASHDERRFAVFDVGDGRKQDRAFFQSMREGMVLGGDRALLSYLQKFDLSGVDLNAAPNTAGLLSQKEASLDLVHQWWFSCLSGAKIAGLEFSDSWPETVEVDMFRAAFRKYTTNLNARSRLPNDYTFGKLLKRACKSVDTQRQRAGGAKLMTVYKIPPLEECRAAWATFIGHDVEWPS